MGTPLLERCYYKCFSVFMIGPEVVGQKSKHSDIVMRNVQWKVESGTKDGKEGINGLFTDFSICDLFLL